MDCAGSCTRSAALQRDDFRMLLLLAVQALVASALRMRLPATSLLRLRRLRMQLEAVGSGNLCRIKVTTSLKHQITPKLIGLFR